nr:DUF3106 domain-containing protein [uncultured Acidovorax sp.]
MHPSSPDASPALPAIVLALALLGVFAAVGGQVLIQMRMAPGTLLPAGAEAAVASPNNARTPAQPGAIAVPQVETGPGWETLTTPQKLALYPLAERWALISEAQKRRWLALAATFSSLPEDEQAKFHDRMTDWASLSAQQRNQARLNYAVTNKLARDDKRAQWEAYQALSEEEKRALAARAAPKPKGAATALRPVSPKKLAQVPAATQASPTRPNAPKIPPVTDIGAPRIAAPVPMPAPATPSSPSPSTVETAPVSVPVAVPAALPPLGSSSADMPAAASQPVTPDNSGLYPQ